MGRKKDKKRLDQRLLEVGLAHDLQEAQRLIMAGQVLVDEQRWDKPGQAVSLASHVRLKQQRRFVSRGGEKLWGAVEDFNIKDLFLDAVVLDCGASTGGFTDCALHLGARKVYALDVGYNQLAWKLRTDARVVVMEETDIRDLPGPIDLATTLVLADISFNSLDRLLPAICRAVPLEGVTFLLLVKPQFELHAHEIPEGGIVSDEDSRLKALAISRAALEREGLQLLGHAESRVEGREGNREIFVLARNPGPP